MSEADVWRIQELIAAYERAFEAADADGMAALFWIDDPRFCEVENHIPEPFGRERFRWIMDWIRRNQPPGWRMRFYNTRVHLLSPEVAYSVSLREEEIEGKRTVSRVTLIFLKKKGEWRIVHGHFSRIPEQKGGASGAGDMWSQGGKGVPEGGADAVGGGRGTGNSLLL